MTSDIGSSVRRFLSWWFRELRDSIPGPVRNLMFSPDDDLEIQLDRGEVGFNAIRSGTRTELGWVTYDDSEPGRAARKIRRFVRDAGSSFGSVILRLPSAKVLRPKVDLPIAAAHNLREALSFEMDRNTPFASDEVLFDFRVSGSDAEMERINVDLEVAQKSDVEEAVALLRQLGISPDRVAGPDDGSVVHADMNLLPTSDRPRKSRFLPRLTAATVVVTIILAGVAFGTWLDRRQRTLDRTEARLADLRVDAGTAARALETIDRLRTLLNAVADERRQRPLMIEILHEITVRVPDQHWLTKLTIRGQSLEISGYSGDPAEILRRLNESDMLSDVRFGSPVTRDSRLEMDRFTITAALSQAPEAQ